MVETKKINRVEKQHYRNSKSWKEFREQMKKRQKCCALCGVPLHGHWNLHHVKNCLTLEEYTSKKPSEFLCLCSECHKYGHWIARKSCEIKIFILRKIKSLHCRLYFFVYFLLYRFL